MKYDIQNPRPCLWCEVDPSEHVPMVVEIPDALRLISATDLFAVQCNNCGLMAPAGGTHVLAWRYWNEPESKMEAA